MGTKAAEDWHDPFVPVRNPTSGTSGGASRVNGFTSPDRVESRRPKLRLDLRTMNRLQSELHRLYCQRSPAPAKTGPETGPATGAAPAQSEPLETVRALVMELTRPPCWDDLAGVWYGVQTELELPAPAIAVSGVDGLQLWFSVAEPIAVAQARAFLDGLRTRFLSDIKADRLRLMPAAGAAPAPSHPPLQARLVPAQHEATGNWSAFVAADLAPVFGDTPWLDVAPNEEGQAALLRGVQTMPQPAFEAALEQLRPARPQPHSTPARAATANAATATSTATSTAADALAYPQPATLAGADDPKQFLLRVMHDAAVPLPLRIEAAKALLAHSNERHTLQRD